MNLERFITLHVARPLVGLLSTPLISAHSGVPCERRLPILMYHSISEDEEPGVRPYYKLCTSAHRFAEQMRCLEENDYRGVTLTDGLKWLIEDDPTVHHDADASALALPDRPSPFVRRPVVLTFDDGFRDFYTSAFPVLQGKGFAASVFLPTMFIDEPGRSNGDSGATPAAFRKKQFLNWSEVIDLQRSGIEFGSHTVSHPVLRRLGWPDIESELRNSKSRIEECLSTPVRTFAYPYAFPHTDRDFTRRLRLLLQDVGYKCCVTTQIGRAMGRTSLLALPRIPVNSSDDSAMLQAKLEGAYDWVRAPQLVAKAFKITISTTRQRGDSSNDRVVSGA